MTIRATGALLCAVGFLCASSDLVSAKDQYRRAHPDEFSAKTNSAKTNKGSKSNTRDRMGGGGGAKEPGIVLNLPWNAGDKKAAPKRPTQGSSGEKVMTSSPKSATDYGTVR